MSSLYLSDCTVNHHLQWHQSLPNFELVDLTQGSSSDALTTRTDEGRLLMETIEFTRINRVSTSELLLLPLPLSLSTAIIVLLSSRSGESSLQWLDCSPPSNHKGRMWKL